MQFSIIIEPDALQDVQQAIDFYDEQQIGLGETFEAVLDSHLVSLEINPFFQVHMIMYVAYLSKSSPT